LCRDRRGRDWSTCNWRGDFQRQEFGKRGCGGRIRIAATVLAAMASSAAISAVPAHPVAAAIETGCAVFNADLAGPAVSAAATAHSSEGSAASVVAEAIAGATPLSMGWRVKEPGEQDNE
jgi:hypothetical protein